MGKLVIAKRCGRLANRLVLFANIAAWAEEHSVRVTNYTFQGFSHLFTGTNGTMDCSYPFEGKPAGRLTRLIKRRLNAIRLQYQLTYLFSKILLRIKITRKFIHIISDNDFMSTRSLTDLDVLQSIIEKNTVFLSGWRFRDPELLIKHNVKIKKFFTPVLEYQEQVYKLVQNARDSCEILIGLHVRRGDYENWKSGKYFYSLEEYVAIAQRLMVQYSERHIGFLICSNQTVGEASFKNLQVHISTCSPIVDLYALSECDLLIGPPSTFTQWASFYGNTPLKHIYSAKEEISLQDFAVSDLGQIPGS
jgi:hypothetical protein